MKRLLFALAAIVPLAAAPLDPIKATVYRWQDSKATRRYMSHH